MKKLSWILITLFIFVGCSGPDPTDIKPSVISEPKEAEQVTKKDETIIEESTIEVDEDATESEEDNADEEDRDVESTPEEEAEPVGEEESDTEGQSHESSESETSEMDVEETEEQEEEKQDEPDKQDALISEPESSEDFIMPTVDQVKVSGNQVSEVRAVWLTYLELLTILQNQPELSYRASISDMFDSCIEQNLNTVMFQVRPFSDAMYDSDIFPSSHILTGTEGLGLGYDPFEIAVEEAHKRGLRIEAWINPYRIRNASSKVAIDPESIAYKWLNDGSRRALKTNEGAIVYNPAMEEVQELVVAGVLEIIYNYQVDGIHFDDYFYPTTDLTLDEQEYLTFAYQEDEVSHEDWRRNNVSNLIAKVYKAIHASNRNIVFGISPQGSIDVNYNQLYVDMGKWLSEPGYLDYICPQIYYGYDHGRVPYEATLAKWYELSTLKKPVIVGLAAYKIGFEDQWAGDGKMEWIETESILKRMVESSKLYPDYGGYALFRYDFLFNPTEELEEVMKLELEQLRLIE